MTGVVVSQLTHLYFCDNTLRRKIVNVVGGRYVGQLSSSETTSGGTWFAVMLVPSFAFFRSIYYAGAFNTGGKGVTLGSEIFQTVDIGMCSGDGPFCKSYGFLVVEWIILMVLGLYFEQVIPGASGVRRHPLFFLGMDRRAKADLTISDHVEENVPEDVLAERVYVEGIMDNHESTFDGIVVSKLQKVYTTTKPPVHAVRNVSFTARSGEVTTLIGSNGAGKSSLFRCLTGSMEPSSGGALVNGLSIDNDMPAIHSTMGVCYQQDIQWDVLTLEEHIAFVCRVRGMPAKEITAATTVALQAVDLVRFRKRQSFRCSGGMRRRLSAAMALVGNPKVVIMDEPSAGLDPSTSETLWSAILNARENKTIIITSHSMEETQRLTADKGRVAMLARGQLKTIGRPEELRLRLGRGYRLSASFPASHGAAFHDLVMSLSKEARIETQMSGRQRFVDYSLPKSVPASRVFELMASRRNELQIADWGLSQSSLEDVFLAVTSRDSEVAQAEEFALKDGSLA
jgi:ABC-type multidrug transport system ATPase subunit